MDRMTPAPPTQERLLLEGFLNLGVPEGYRSELIDDDITVTAPPAGDHEDCVGLLVDQICRKADTRMQFSGHKGLKLPRGGLRTQNYAIPDGTWAPMALRLFRGAEPWMPPEGVAMVAEVTSTRADRDRDAKRHCYALADIPLYLLVDREKSSVSLFSDPDGDDYQQADTRPFGKEIRLPAPFACELDTTGF